MRRRRDSKCMYNPLQEQPRGMLANATILYGIKKGALYHERLQQQKRHTRPCLRCVKTIANKPSFVPGRTCFTQGRPRSSKTYVMLDTH